MIKLSKKNSVIGIALAAALLLAFFPTSSFIKNPFIVETNLKQQNYNEAGIFTITPFQAAQYYSYDQSKCYWIDLRDAKEFSASHLKTATNQTFKQLHSSSWNANDLVLVYGNNTDEAQQAVAFLRQVKDTRAFAVKGGYDAVKKYLIDPIGISITNQLSDKDIQTLIELRNKISGEKASAGQSLDKLKSSKSSAVREGC